MKKGDFEMGCFKEDLHVVCQKAGKLLEVLFRSGHLPYLRDEASLI